MNSASRPVSVCRPISPTARIAAWGPPVSWLDATPADQPYGLANGGLEEPPSDPKLNSVSLTLRLERTAQRACYGYCTGF